MTSKATNVLRAYTGANKTSIKLEADPNINPYKTSEINVKGTARQNINNQAIVNVVAVNDLPEIAGSVLLGSIFGKQGFEVTQEQLLARASDADGDLLSVIDLKIDQGQGSIKDNGDNTWSYIPGEKWDSVVTFAYNVSDGGNEVVAAKRTLIIFEH